MIVSINSEPNSDVFCNLLNNTLQQLNLDAAKADFEADKFMGKDLEPYVKEVMSHYALGTPFENTIELISGQRFPDIIANRFYGIEVKTTKQNQWKSTGNSILETTRVADVERIYMLFGKMAEPIEFRCRPYQDVLYDVAVTHSPRYLIDMNLPKGETIFDKVNVEYDVLRKNPIKPIKDYYRSKMGEGDELWWLDSDDVSKASKMLIRLWKNLPESEKLEIKAKGMVLFPKLFSASPDKFESFAMWLTTIQSIVCSNIRDIFTAGGRQNITLFGSQYNLPRIFGHLFENIEAIFAELITTSAAELAESWEFNTTEKTKVRDWIFQVSKNVEQNGQVRKPFDLEIILNQFAAQIL